MLKSLQAGRGVAAIMVVLYHLNGSIFGNKGYDAAQISSVFEIGRSGVDFFFALSGFIIYHVHKRDIGRPLELTRYAFKRFVRIYPPYWIVLLAILPIYFLRPGFGLGNETEPLHIFTSAMLWPTPGNPILSVAWTLRHEVLFYLIFAALVVHARVGIIVIGGWFVGCGLSLFFEGAGFPASFLLAEINLLFLFGMATAWAFAHLPLKFKSACISLTVGVVVFALTGARLIGDAAATLTHLGFGLGSALIILGAVNLERQGKLFVPRFLEFLGNASYSIYLTHFIVLSFAAKVVFGAGIASHIPRVATFTLLLVAGVGAGCAFYLLIERRIVSSLAHGFKAPRKNGELTTLSR